MYLKSIEPQGEVMAYQYSELSDLAKEYAYIAYEESQGNTAIDQSDFSDLSDENEWEYNICGEEI